MISNNHSIYIQFDKKIDFDLNTCVLLYFSMRFKADELYVGSCNNFHFFVFSKHNSKHNSDYVAKRVEEFEQLIEAPVVCISNIEKQLKKELPEFLASKGIHFGCNVSIEMRNQIFSNFELCNLGSGNFSAKPKPFSSEPKQNLEPTANNVGLNDQIWKLKQQLEAQIQVLERELNQVKTWVNFEEQKK